MNNKFNLIEFFKMIWKWRKPIGIVVITSVIGAIVITDPHIMAPCYSSTAIIYPLNPNLTNTSSLFGQNEQFYFGGTEDVDRVLSIASSTPLKLYLINKYHLFNHYKIDSASVAYPIYEVTRELESNFSVIKNDRGGINITMIDHDKNLAANMANDAVNQIDNMNRQLILSNKEKILTIYKNKVQEKEVQLNQLGDSILKLKNEFDINGDIIDLNKQVAGSKGVNANDYMKADESIKVLEEQKKGAIRELNNSQGALEQYEATISQEVPTISILEKAYPSEKKDSPVRWLITLAAGLIAFALSALAVLLIERFKNIKAAFADVPASSH